MDEVQVSNRGHGSFQHVKENYYYYYYYYYYFSSFSDVASLAST
jgi:hypothetical protein